MLDSGESSVQEEPVKVKVWFLYGLVARTRQSYLRYAAFEVLCLVALGSLWFLWWRPIGDPPRGTPPVLKPWHELTPTQRFLVAAMNASPWIILGAIAYKLLELWIVLRRFALKEEERLRRSSAARASQVNAGSG
jgi:hypothetical protein